MMLTMFSSVRYRAETHPEDHHHQKNDPRGRWNFRERKQCIIMVLT